MTNKSVTVVFAAISGLIAGVIVTWMFIQFAGSADVADKQSQPQYWVAPMDPNYRRDKPGKSPMGMDLIPVYESDTDTSDRLGMITISPEVINNLGVRTSSVALKPMQTNIQTVGYVRYDEDKLIHVHPRVSGWVEKLFVNAAGDPVKDGEPLYSLYSPELVNAQEELVLALNRKNERLVKSARLKLKALHVPHQMINELMRTREIQQAITFYAPQTGVIDHLNIREGFYVEPGTTMFSLGALDTVWVEGEVFERQAGLIHQGDSVTMYLDYVPGVEWQGIVDYVYPTLDERTRTVKIRSKFVNTGKVLKPNMFAQLSIQSKKTTEVLVIPREALIRTGHQNRVVLALGEGRFKSIAVKVGRIDQTYAEIREGLEEGDSIVISAQFLLDSESSKTSDFQRMHPADAKPESVWVAAVIKEQFRTDGIVSARHEAIDDWGWPAMTMKFEIADVVNIEPLTPGTQLHMQIRESTEHAYEITAVHIMSHGDVGYSNADHGEMNHGEMNHGEMNHGQPTPFSHSR